jgi:hypothetical protein
MQLRHSPHAIGALPQILVHMGREDDDLKRASRPPSRVLEADARVLRLWKEVE